MTFDFIKDIRLGDIINMVVGSMAVFLSIFTIKESKKNTKEAKQSLSWILDNSMRISKSQAYVLDAIRNKSTNISISATAIAGGNLSSPNLITIQSFLSKFRNFPGFYILLYAISKTNSTSISQLASYQYTFPFPRNWQIAIKKLFEPESIFIIEGESFSFKSNEIRDAFNEFFKNKENVIEELISTFKHRPENQRILSDTCDKLFQ
jgi:hypothetical protein